MTELVAASWLRPALAVVCYVGIVLYGGVLSVPGRGRHVASWQLLLFYIGSFPVREPSLAWLAQQAMLAVALASLGPENLFYHLQQRLELERERRGAAPIRLPAAARLLPVLPAVLVVGFVFWDCGRALSAGEAAPVLAAFRRGWALIYLTLAGYLGATWLLGRRWARTAARIRLLSMAIRFHSMNALGALGFLVVAALFATQSPGSASTQYATLAIAVGFLLAGLNELAWSYDAVLSRVLAFHVIAFVASLIVFGGLHVASQIGLGPTQGRAMVIALVAIAAMALPEPVTRRVEERLFPRASRLRARLAGLAGEPLASTIRAEAAGELLQRAVAVLDAEGGIVVVGASGTEAAVLRVAGRADAVPLGPSDAASRYLARLLARDRPRLAEQLPMADQLRLLRCEVVLAVPFAVGQARATLLLGRRRGWLYDGPTIEAIHQLAGQAGLLLENLALLRARAHAEKLAALGEAAARIAHEIRNPLAAARSLVQLAGRSEAVAPLAEPALVELDRIARLAGDLVAFARRDEAMRQADLDLAEVCREALAQVGPLAESAGVTIETELGSVAVRGDRDRLVQVVANLCRNSIEAFEETGEPGAAVAPRVLRVRSASDAAPGGARTAVLEVCDNGPGIAPHELESIFEPFRTTKSAGTGLGLPIARRIVEAHGGRLIVDSTPGAGTAFRAELSLRPWEPGASQPGVR